jgi:NAD(P)-dependent dehydrogenase (short-subunit alcohol dehydrogenase family)
LADAGASVVVADIDVDAAGVVVDEVTRRGRAAASAACDVTVDGDFLALREATLDRFGRIDIVMNNVGALAFGTPLDIPLSQWQRIIDINLLSHVRSNAVFVPHFLAQGAGHIVNTASTSGLWAYSYDRLPYVATKFGVVGMSEALALYLHPRGIRVTCLCPGGINGGDIARSAPTFGDEPRVRFDAGITRRDAYDIGQLVVDAIVNKRFFVPTGPEVPSILANRAADHDAFLARTIAGIESSRQPDDREDPMTSPAPQREGSPA